MPSRPIEAHSKKENRRKQPRPHPNARQHGNLHGLAHIASGTADVLLSIPSESLTHVTSFLDPPDLLSLARTCKSLHAHVADDNTWRRAYVYQYFGVTPESDLRDDETLMLRREESSWKREFVLRYNLTRYVIAFSTIGGVICYVGAHRCVRYICLGAASLLQCGRLYAQIIRMCVLSSTERRYGPRDMERELDLFQPSLALCVWKYRFPVSAVCRICHACEGRSSASPFVVDGLLINHCYSCTSAIQMSSAILVHFTS